MTREVLNALSGALATSDTVALVAIVATRVDAAADRCRMVLLRRTDRQDDWRRCYENDAATKARESCAAADGRGSSTTTERRHVEETGLICRAADVFIEPIEPAPHLYILGAGHVGWQLRRLAPSAGFRVHVDDRRNSRTTKGSGAEEIVVD
jgi:xanthine/CO dehydrogenase XdhC/CoxF family maturation factor